MSTPSQSQLCWTLRPRVLYTTVFAWISVCSGRFLAPFLEHECHLSETEIGLLCGAQFLLGIPGAGLAGRLADQWEAQAPGKGRARMLCLGVVSGTCFYLLHGLGRLFGKDPTKIAVTSIFTSMPWFLLLRILSSASTSMVMPVLDGICLQYLETNKQSKQEFGKERLFGAISWAITNLLMAPALDGPSGFAVTYVLSIIFAGAVLLTMVFYTATNANENTDITVNAHHHSIKRRTSDLSPSEASGVTSNSIEYSKTAPPELKELLHRVLFGSQLGWHFGWAMVFACTALAAGQVIVESLIFLYFEELGSSYAIMGWTVVLTVIFEIPIFHIADRLLQRCGSTRLLQTAMLCYVTRVVGYSFLPQGKVVYALILEPLHGITYACSTTAVVDFVASVMPLGSEASGQGMVNAIRGMGSVLGLVLGGWADDTLGPRIMYRSAAAVVLVGSLVLACASLVGTASANTNTKESFPRHYLYRVPQTEQDDNIELTAIDEEGSFDSGNSILETDNSILDSYTVQRTGQTSREEEEQQKHYSSTVQ